MPRFIKIGRDIIVGKGFAAKHWAGSIVFGESAIFVSPNGTVESIKAGVDSGAMASGFVSAVGDAIASAQNPGNEEARRWQDYVIHVTDLPSEITGDQDWPLSQKSRAIIVIPRESASNIRRKRGRILVDAYGTTFKLGMRLFGRAKILQTIRDLGWGALE